MCVYVFVYTYQICKHVICTCLYIYIYIVHICASKCVYVHLSAYMCIYVHICVLCFVCVCAYRIIYIIIYTRLYTHLRYNNTCIQNVIAVK